MYGGGRLSVEGMPHGKRQLAREQERQLATLPLAERIPSTSKQRRRALRLVLTGIIAEVPTMTSLIEHERDLAQRQRETGEAGATPGPRTETY